MSISSISSVASSSSVGSVQFQRSMHVAGSDSDSGGDSTAMSNIGKFMSKLSALEKSDPAKAKQVLSTIASKLNDAASSATGDEATHLKDLAAKFTKAADTGDLSGIQPPKGGPGGFHKPSSTDDSSSSSDGTTASAAAMTEKYKAAGAKPDFASLDKMFEDAYSSVTGSAS